MTDSTGVPADAPAPQPSAWTPPPTSPQTQPVPPRPSSWRPSPVPPSAAPPASMAAGGAWTPPPTPALQDAPAPQPAPDSRVPTWTPAAQPRLYDGHANEQGEFLRRPSLHSRKFTPRPEPQKADDVVLQRNVLRSAAAPQGPRPPRQRLIAGDLPDWEPVPPGELVVVRRSK